MCTVVVDLNLFLNIVLRLYISLLIGCAGPRFYLLNRIEVVSEECSLEIVVDEYLIRRDFWQWISMQSPSLVSMVKSNDKCTCTRWDLQK